MMTYSDNFFEDIRGRFWASRKSVWDNALRLFYHVADKVHSLPKDSYSSLLITAGNFGGVIENSEQMLDWYQLSQRMGLGTEAGKPPAATIKRRGTVDMLVEMMRKKPGKKEVDGAVPADSKGRISVMMREGTRMLYTDLRALKELRGGRRIEGGTGRNALASISMILPGVAGYHCTKDGGDVIEYVGGFRNVQYYPGRGIFVVSTRIMVPTHEGESGRVKNMKFMEVDRKAARKTPFDSKGEPGRRCVLTKQEGKLFCAD